MADVTVPLEAFGALSDGTTDNSGALNALGAWARQESAAGRMVAVEASPGVYNFDHSRCEGWMLGIRRMVFEGNGAVFQNTYDRSVHGDNFGHELAWAAGARPLLYGDGTNGFLIAPTSVGQTTIRVKAIPDLAHFAVGDWVLISALDVQYYGYPPNPDQFEFNRIVAIDPMTGLLALEAPVRFAYRDDYPDVVSAPGVNACGKARVWSLRGPSGEPWGVEHVFRNLEIRRAPNSGLTYFSITGRRVRFENCKLVGLSPTVADRVEVVDCEILDVGEPDKIVNSFVCDRVVFRKGGPVFQSSSINQVSLRDCEVVGGLQIGCAKHVLVQGGQFDWVSAGVGGQPYGMGRTATLIGAKINKTFDAYPNAQGGAQAIDGSSVTYADGTISVQKGLAWHHNAVPGQWVSLDTAEGFHPGAKGVGLVTALSEDDTSLKIHTTLPYATLPSWAGGTFILLRTGLLRFVDCFGDEDANILSEASARGFRPGQLFKQTIASPIATYDYWSGRIGDLKRVSVDVLKPMPGVAFRMTHYGVVTADTFSDAKIYEVAIDLGIVGRRDFTQSALSGKAPYDAVTLGGASQSALPKNRWFRGDSLFYGFSNIDVPNLPGWQRPLVSVELEFDPGPFGSRVAA